MELEDFWDFINDMYLEIREEKIEKMYFANPMQDKDYKTFRDEIIQRSEEGSKSQEEKMKEAKDAQRQLDDFFKDLRKEVDDG